MREGFGPTENPKMGHRASVAYLRPDGTVQAHYSHWGALELGLVDDLTPNTPLGSMKEPEFFTAIKGQFEKMADSMDGFSVAFGHSGDAVDRKPYGAFASLEDWAADGIDFLFHEAAYVVNPDPWEVTGYDTVRYHGDDSNATGLLVEIDPEEWGDFSSMTYDWDDQPETVGEFERRVTEAAGNHTIPTWSLNALRRKAQTHD